MSNQDDPTNDESSPGKPYFSDTHFPVHSVLSRHFGTFLGNSSTTFMLVTIQKPAQFQQQVSGLPDLAWSNRTKRRCGFSQAIQSLLYACKAKDIRSTCTIHYLSVLTKRQPHHRQLQLPEINEHDGHDISESTRSSEDNEAALSSPMSVLSSRISPLSMGVTDYIVRM